MRYFHVRRSAGFAIAALLLIANPAFADDDPVAQAFTPDLRAMLGRDSRCSDARAAADKFALNLEEGPAAVDVIKTTDKCIALSRLSTGWEDFNAAVLTINAAATLAVARLTHEQRLYDRARTYAEHVPGYSLILANGHWASTTMRRSGVETDGSQVPEQPPEQNGRTIYSNTTSYKASSGPSGTARIASMIGYEATVAVKNRQPVPKPTTSP